MKIKQTTFGFLALFTGASAFSATGSLSDIYGVPPSSVVYFSGTSSLTGSTKTGVAGGVTGAFVAGVTALCDGGSRSIRVLGIDTKARKPFSGNGSGVAPKGPGSLSDGYVAVCTTRSIDNRFAGPFAIVKREINGSFDGVGPVIEQTALHQWLDINWCSDVEGVCAVDWVTPIVPHAGLSDVDTKVWIGSNSTGALSVPVSTNIANTVFYGGFAGQGFGVMVSESLYNAMMVKQVAEGRLPVDCATGDFTAGRCQPSISKAEYAAVIDGSNFSYIANGALTGDAGVVNLCGRVETSGTQATANVYFLNNPCGSASPTFGFKAPKKVELLSGTAVAFSSLSGNAVTGNYDDFGGLFGLFEGSGTGDALNCVIRRNNGRNPNNIADSLGGYAIGWISLSNIPATNGQFQGRGWRLIKLDGVSPNAYQVPLASAADTADGGSPDGWAQDSSQRINVINGRYDAAFELEMLWPSSTNFETFLASLRKIFADPRLMNTPGVFQANGVFTNEDAPTQVHTGTRAGNSCEPVTLYK